MSYSHHDRKWKKSEEWNPTVKLEHTLYFYFFHGNTIFLHFFLILRIYKCVRHCVTTGLRQQPREW